jgi:hypothetical protein
MSQCLILIDALSSAFWEEEKEKKREMAGGLAFFLGPDLPCWLCHVAFSWQLGAIKG